MSITIVAGTRPEAIKLSPVINALRTMRQDFCFVWSGQHYDYEMSRVFFEQLKLPEPDVNLDVKSGSHAEQTSRLMVGLEQHIRNTRPSLVIAEGDTNTVLATALTSAKMMVPFGHVEAGLRSWDFTMPEEVNRIVADSLALVDFAPTELALINLMHQGVEGSRTILTGNPIVDVVKENKRSAYEQGTKLTRELGISKYDYFLVTVHRQENTDDLGKLKSIMGALAKLAKHYSVIFPVHPRTVNRLKSLGLFNQIQTRQLRMIEPQGYLQFLGLMEFSLSVLTDSGGVQEEACTLRVPTITLRDNTERPETVKIGVNRLVGVDPKRIVSESIRSALSRREIAGRLLARKNPFGDGNAGKRIAESCMRAVEEGLKVRTVNTKSNPYITFAIRPAADASKKGRLALYDYRGIATASSAKAKTAVVKGSLRGMLLSGRRLKVDCLEAPRSREFVSAKR